MKNIHAQHLASLKWKGKTKEEKRKMTEKAIQAMAKANTKKVIPN